MGLFSDTCTMLIDPATKRALTGEALEKAKQDPRWPRCGYSVKKKARICSRCGHGAPGGWSQCPSCRNWVGNESNFCWNCKTALHPESRDEIAGGVWQKPREGFARRLEVGDIKLALQKGIQIQTGTAAIVLDSGAYKDVLGPGRHNLDSLARRINYWGDPPPRSVILVDSGDVVLPLVTSGLRTSEDIPVDFYAEVCFRFVEKGAEAFVANLFKASERLSYDDLVKTLNGEIRYEVENVCNTSTVEDLVKDPERRTHLEDALQKRLEEVLKRYGLEIVRVASADFSGEAYEKLRAKSGDLELKRREFEFSARLREMLASDKMQELKTEHDLEAYVLQLAQEKGVSTEMRNQELALLKQVHRHELEKGEAAHQMEREMQQAAHAIGVKIIWDDYAFKKLVKEAEAAAAVRRIAFDQEKAETEWALKTRIEKDRIKREDLAETAKILEGKSLQTLIATIDDPERREQLLKLSAQMQQQGQSVEAILAMAADKSPAAAQALAEMARGNRQQMEREFQERQKMTEDAAQRLERIMTEALKAVAEAGKHAGTTIQNLR